MTHTPQSAVPDAADVIDVDELTALSRQIEAIASRAAEEIEAACFAYAKRFRKRAGADEIQNSND